MPTLQEQAKSVFDQALEIESTQDRSNFLDDQFLRHPEIRDAVEGLLQAYNDAGSFLESPAVSPPETEDASVPSEPPSQQIGPYKLLQKIGEGGMGTVFMAEQTRPISRRVAVKIIKLGMDTKSVIARFEAERQALAMMDHPNIAKVLDAGTTDDGRPYFVMELVKGVPITEYCDDHKLAIRERLELFTQVCQAVQHAHQKGIIHRDIKPSNVLVAQYDGSPVPKVIDFGVAKAISQRLTEKTMFTQYGQMVGTLEYMSPEQAQFNQLDVDTRSDIYSLGVLLYELLTGETPFDGKRLRSSAFEEVLRILREEEPPKPSNRISTLGEQATKVSENRSLEATRLGTALRGDLDWIVMKSLEKDRDRRYETANALLQDLGRFLSDQPVEARRPSNAYRLRKYVRRNRGLVASFSTIVLLMAFGLTMNYVSLRKARDQEQLAQQALGSLRDVALEHAISETLTCDPSRAAAAIQLAEQASVDAEWLAVLDGFRLAGDGKYEQAVMELEPFTQPGDTHPSYLCALATLACAHINSGHDREYLDCMRRLRELIPNTSDEILFAATAESASDPERVVGLLASPIHDWRHIWAVALRGGARGWIALQNNDPVMMSSAITDLEFAELFSGATPGLTVLKAITLRTADEIARLTGDEIAQRESRNRLLAMTEELSRLPPSRLIGTNLISTHDRLGQFDDLIRTVQSMDFGDTVMIEYAAAPMYARCDNASKELKIFSDLEFDKNNTYALISRAHFLADLPDRRSELIELYKKAIANKQDSPQERYQALNILALAQEPKMLRQEANVILHAFEENELADWGIKEGLLIASGKWDSTDLEKTESIFTRCTAYYFLGMRCLADGNAEEAAQHFQTSYDTGVHSFFEYAWSKAYLRRMQKDPSWPSWISATNKPESN